MPISKRLRVLEVLWTALTIIQHRDRWTKDLPAKLKDGSSCIRSSSRAVCFCLIGAIQKAAGRAKQSELQGLYELSYTIQCRHHRPLFEIDDPVEGGWPVLYRFNDWSGRKHKDVLRVIVETIMRIERVGLRKAPPQAFQYVPKKRKPRRKRRGSPFVPKDEYVFVVQYPQWHKRFVKP